MPKRFGVIEAPLAMRGAKTLTVDPDTFLEELCVDESLVAYPGYATMRGTLRDDAPPGAFMVGNPATIVEREIARLGVYRVFVDDGGTDA